MNLNLTKIKRPLLTGAEWVSVIDVPSYPWMDGSKDECMDLFDLIFLPQVFHE